MTNTMYIQQFLHAWTFLQLTLRFEETSNNFNLQQNNLLESKISLSSIIAEYHKQLDKNSQ